MWSIGKPSQRGKLGLSPGNLCSDKQTALYNLPVRSVSRVETDICICQGLALLNIQITFTMLAVGLCSIGIFIF